MHLSARAAGAAIRGRRIELGQQADNPEPHQQRNRGRTLLLWFVALPCLRSLAELIRLSRGIDQGHTRHLVGIPGGVRLHVHAAKRVAHQHVRPFESSFAEQGVQFACDLPGVPGIGTHLAPAHPRAVVGAHASGTGDLPLHPDPLGRNTPRSWYRDTNAHSRAVGMTKNQQKEVSSRLLETISLSYADPAGSSTVLQEDYSIRGRGTKRLVPLPLTERLAVLTRMCLQATCLAGVANRPTGLVRFGPPPHVPARRCFIVREQR